MGGRGSACGLWVRDGGEVAVADSDQVEQAVEAEVRQGMVSALPDQWLGAEGDAHPGEVEHGQVVGSVADGDDLLEGDLFLPGDALEKLGLSSSVDDAAAYVTGNDAVRDLKGVGIDVVDAEALLEMAGEEGESAGEDGGFVAQHLEGADELLGAFGERDAPDQVEDAGL